MDTLCLHQPSWYLYIYMNKHTIESLLIYIYIEWNVMGSTVELLAPKVPTSLDLWMYWTGSNLGVKSLEKRGELEISSLTKSLGVCRQ